MDVNEEFKFLGKFTKKIKGGVGRFGGSRVDVNEELKFFVKILNKKWGGGGGLGSGLGWSGWIVNEELKFL